MIRTKHLYIVVCLAFLILLGILLSVRFIRERIQDSDLFVASDATYDVTHTTPSTQFDRDAFIQRVRDSLRTEEIYKDTTQDEARATSTSDHPPKPVIGMTSQTPRKGSIFVCSDGSRDVSPIKDAPWITDGVYDASQKPIVSGSNVVEDFHAINTTETERVITTNGLPSHHIGTFPAQSPVGNNVYAITPQSMMMRVPKVPVLAREASCVPRGGSVGILLSGALLYSGVLDDDYDARAHTQSDECGGHIDLQGVYHYHTESACVQKDGDGRIGYARDGFGIYSKIENGVPVNGETLDACNGHAHVILWDGVPTYLYHYHMTESYPYSLGCFMGTPQDIVSGG